ncbi:GroES-like protein [Sphaerulina musiva SO2202]|uniref:GroES-like protein n=1 Tax=Sphaerulina musiva (strain SO2202) TaxID=692275 RepID=M3C439_SPHMS|nr:GroES-like protein [Sphaerulina musiva SO2202]EMF15021.1 GroES-like protein [Sphaerulina musiva SO2202]
MKAARYYGNHDIRIDQVEEPTPGEGQLIVDVEWCGICGSDLHEYLTGPSNLIPTPANPTPSGVHIPITMGHELCGRVRHPPPGSQFKHNDPVMIDPRITCRNYNHPSSSSPSSSPSPCLPCSSHLSHCCSQLGYVGGTTGFGGFGQVVVISEDRLLPLPPSISLEHAAVIEPLSVVHHAIKISSIPADSWKEKFVFVIGGGPIGFALLLILKALGAEKVMVSEPTATRRRQVSEVAWKVVDPVGENVVERVSEWTGGKGVEVVFDCAGVEVGLKSGMEVLRNYGLYVMVAVWPKPITIPCWTFLAKHITMKGTLIFADSDMEEVIAMMAAGKLAGYEKLVTGRIALDDIVKEGFEELVNHKDEHIKILVTPNRRRDSITE